MCKDDEITKTNEKRLKHVKITYSIRKEGQTLLIDDFESKLNLNHLFSIDKKNKEVTIRV